MTYFKRLFGLGHAKAMNLLPSLLQLSPINFFFLSINLLLKFFLKKCL